MLLEALNATLLFLRSRRFKMARRRRGVGTGGPRFQDCALDIASPYCASLGELFSGASVDYCRRGSECNGLWVLKKSLFLKTTKN